MTGRRVSESVSQRALLPGSWVDAAQRWVFASPKLGPRMSGSRQEWGVSRFSFNNKSPSHPVDSNQRDPHPFSHLTGYFVYDTACSFRLKIASIYFQLSMISFASFICSSEIFPIIWLPNCSWSGRSVCAEKAFLEEKIYHHHRVICWFQRPDHLSSVRY